MRSSRKSSFPVKPASFCLGLFLLALPASSNYRLKDYGLGSGGVADASSSSYSASMISGETGGGVSGAGYDLGAGLVFASQAGVPAAPFLTNPGNYYNRLKIVLNPSGNPDDAGFAVAMSSDDFATVKYVQDDGTLGPVLGPEDYRTFSEWGGAEGTFVAGLAPDTTYKAKAKAMHGTFTETGYGPVATASTVGLTLSFDVDVAPSDADTAPPFAVDFGELTAGTVATSSQKIWVDLSTNGESGGRVYLSSRHGGLLSVRAGHRIDSVSGNLAALAQGFGAQGVSAAQVSGGPLGIALPYAYSGDTVGVADQSLREVFVASFPVTGGRGALLLKAKASSVTPAAGDYAEVLSIVAAASF
jgi:hypothetical protein